MNIIQFVRTWKNGLLIAGTFLIVNLMLLGSFGVSWDEPLHAQWAVRIVDHLVNGKPGLPDLAGKGIFYGPAYYLLNYAVMNFGIAVGLDAVPALHLLNVIFASAGIFCAYGCARVLTNERTAALSASLLALYPPLLAHAHSNPKDMPTMVMVTACLWSYAAYMQKRSWQRTIIAGVLTGLAFAMKITGLMAVPIFLIAYVAHISITASDRKTVLMTDAKRLPIACIAVIVTIFIGWPTLWRDPTLLLKSIDIFLRGDFWSGTVRYFGTVYDGTQLPWHYTPMWLLMQTPIIITLLCIAGIGLTFARIAKRDIFGPLLILTWLFFPILMSMKPGLARYDGMRQIMLVLPALAMLAAIALDALPNAIAKNNNNPIVSRVVIGMLFVWLVMESARAHPYQGSYMNEAVRWKFPANLEEQFEIEYWGTTYKEGIEWLEQHAHKNAKICVPFVGQLMLFYTDHFRSDFTFGCEDDRTYIMYFTRNDSINDQYAGIGDIVFRIRRYNSDLLRIHEIRR